jgi:hypothetical protein
MWLTKVLCGFLSAFAKLRKVTICFALSSCLSVRVEKLVSHCTDFHEIWIIECFSKICGKIEVSWKSDENNGCFTWICGTFMIYRRLILRMRNVLDKLWRNQNSFMLNSFFPPENRAIYEIMWKKIWYSWTGHMWQYNTAHAHCMLYN